MTDRVIQMREGHEYVMSGSLVCPSHEVCDIVGDESYDDYVCRHALDHNLGAFTRLVDAERNLGMNCFYYFHKYIWGNPELTPIPFWETHAFIAEAEWNIDDLEMNVPMDKRAHVIPPAAQRRPGERRQMKQVEVPRQCQKTSIGARAHTVFEHMREYFINDRANFRTIVRSATGKNTRDTLAIIRRMASKSQKIASLYGIWLVRCAACGTSSQTVEKTLLCPRCGDEKKTRCRRISLINETRGAGAYGQDMVLFRWLTDKEDADAVAAYSVWVAGLETETTGQRPDRYKWDDPQTDKNARTPELRAKILTRFDDTVNQLQFGGELLVLDTRKFVDDFAAKIRQEPLSSLFFSLHRKVRWPTDEPENPPYVVNGYRYYYPVKGTGDPALDETKVNNLERHMNERNFSAEYMNEPLDPSKALFKREHFKVVSRDKVPPEIQYGLGQNLAPSEDQELRRLGVRIIGYNSCDPAGKEAQSVRGDDTFIVGLRVDRWGAVYVTYLAAGKWSASRTWDEIHAANNYNRPEFTDYELPADDKHVKPSFEKWSRERAESLGAPVAIPMKWQPMPKSQKYQRIEQMAQFVPLTILEDCAAPELIEKYIGQWIGYLVSDHDDGPDATSRLIRWLITNTYQQPKHEEEELMTSVSGDVHLPFTRIRDEAMRPVETGTLWGQTGY